MNPPPKWYMPVAIVALLWNLLGCFAFITEVMISPEAIAEMNEAQQAIYESRASWMVAATAAAVWGGAVGCLGLILRKRWAKPVLVLSLLGVIVQDIGLFVVTDAGSLAGPSAFVLQGLVLLIAIGLALLGRRAAAEGWIA